MVDTITRWSGIESEELNAQNWIQVGFRFNDQKHREYRVFGELYGEKFDEEYSSNDEDNKSLAYSYYQKQLERIQGVQTFLFDAYEVWDQDFVDIACKDCAVKFAEERGLEWHDSFQETWTEDAEEKGAGASCIPSWGMGESDYPYSCCDLYLKTNFTPEGQDYLKSDFPKGVQELYGY